jgi:hypothetical protein
MGISKIGDVLSILRHAKTVHAEQERHKAASLFSEKEKSGIRTSVVSPLPTVDMPQSEPTPRTNQLISNGSRTLALGGFADSWLRSDVHKLKTLSSESMKTEKRREIIPPRKTKAAVSIEQLDARSTKKSTEADAGDYVVKMPRGTTAKTRRVLQMQTAQKATGNIFSRLDTQSQLNRNQTVPKAVKVQSTNSVFSRLGVTTSTQTVGKRHVQASGTLQVGVRGSTRTVNAGQRKLAERERSVFDRLGT